jgi:septum formation protein
MTLVLASRSPQRRAILEQLGLTFDVRPTAAEELGEGDPLQVALVNARRKAAACAAAPGETVIAVDTLVALDGRIYGKPAGEDGARATLAALSGRTHQVVSGMVAAGREATAVTEVDFRAIGPGLLDWYVATGEWRERAGGYAIQGRGAALVTGIRGDYLNVVGLPVPTLLDLLPGLVGY